MSVLHVLLVRVECNIGQCFTHSIRIIAARTTYQSSMHHVSGSYTCQGCTYLVSRLLVPHVRTPCITCQAPTCFRAARTMCHGCSYHVPMHHVSGSYMFQGCTYHVSRLLVPRNRAPCITCQVPTRVRAARTLCHGCSYHRSGSYPARIRAACTTCTKYMNLVSNFV